MVRTRSATWRMRSSGRLPSIEARCSSQAFASRRSESDIEVPFRAGHCAGPATTAKVDGGTPFSPHTLKSMSSDIIDANGSLHASDNGRFTGHVQAEGDADEALANPLASQPFMVAVRLERWDSRDNVEVMSTVEFDASPLLRGLDPDRRQSTLDRFGGADWLFESAVERGLVEPWGGPFTVDFEPDEMEAWCNANPTDTTTSIRDYDLRDLADLVGVDRPEPGTPASAFLFRARDAIAGMLDQAREVGGISRSLHTAAREKILNVGTHQGWEEFVSLKLYEQRFASHADEVDSGFGDVQSSRTWRLVNEAIWKVRNETGLEAVPEDPAPTVQQGQVVDLVAALRESMEAAKRRRLGAANGDS